jgi:hypothetical protein
MELAENHCGGDAMDIYKALSSPASCFARPADVVAMRGLTRDQKVEILHHWEYDARLVEEAQNENMIGPQPSVLSEVLDALHALHATSSFS